MIDAEKELQSLAEEKYAEFSKSLIPGDCKVLGVRIPALRDLAKRIAKDDWKGYLSSWMNRYLEDVLLRSFVISYVKVPLEERLQLFREHIPLIENWSSCDSFCMTWKPKFDEKQTVWEFILPYLDTGEEFKMRYCAVMMMDNFIDDEHIDEIITRLDSAKNDGYYFKMGVAWALSMCFVKYPDKMMPYLKGENSLDDFTYNKTLQKITESYRPSDEVKKEIGAMRRPVRR